MINIFQSSYDARLKSWYDLRLSLQHKEVSEICQKVDEWWQQAPLVNHHLHPMDKTAWPGPWELLSDNTYCTIARGLGMCYTLAFLGISSIDFCLGMNDNSEDVTLVLVEDAKYILNYYPDTVLSNTLTEFKITVKMDLTDIIKKIK